MGFQNINKLLKSDKQNLNCRYLKPKPLRYSTTIVSINFVQRYQCLYVQDFSLYMRYLELLALQFYMEEFCMK